MNRLGFQLLLAGSLLASDHASFAATLTIDFEELPLESEDFYNGSDLAGGFSSYGVSFNNEFSSLFGSWQGWAYSQQTPDPNDSGFENQYRAYVGSGAGGSAKFGVAFSGFDAGGGIIPQITLPENSEPTSVKVTNTTYAALSMLLGDSFAKQFGDSSGDGPDDWFLLKVKGFNAADTFVGEVELYLADYRFADPNEDYILDQWTDLDLTPLSGLGVWKLAFRLTSSDEGSLGMNTPAYVAIDNLVLDVTVTPGDFDLNGIVDHLDLEIWEQHYGTALGAGVTTGDADEDGDVDGVDLLAWQLNFSPPQPLSVAVPEPSAALMILSWSILFRCLRQKFGFVDDTL